MARGNWRQPIFLDDSDRREFMHIFSEVISRFCWRCLTYCLMGNHYHLVVCTEQPNLSEGMRQLNGIYAQRFNKRHDNCGHVFQGRFVSVLVRSNTYIRELARYIALNPVRAGVCRCPEKWRWSAHKQLIGTDSDGPVNDRDLLENFGSDLNRARESYRQFVEGDPEGWSPETEAAVVGRIPLGVGRLYKTTSKFSHGQVWLDRPPLNKVIEGRDLDDAFVTAHLEYGYSMRQVAAALGCHHSTISRRLKSIVSEKDS